MRRLQKIVTTLLVLGFFGTSKNSVTILHQNIGGILNKQNQLELAIDELKANNINVDIICLTETFILSGEEQNLALQDYQLVSFWSRPSQKRGGVCILFRKEINFSKLPWTKELTVKSIFECCAVSIPDKNLIIVCIYTTPYSINKAPFFL